MCDVWCVMCVCKRDGRRRGSGVEWEVGCERWEREPGKRPRGGGERRRRECRGEREVKARKREVNKRAVLFFLLP